VSSSRLNCRRQPTEWQKNDGQIKLVCCCVLFLRKPLPREIQLLA
jgi:hypothetical protein